METSAASAASTRIGVVPTAAIDVEDDAKHPLCKSETTTTNTKMPTVNARADRFPFCIVWSPIPIITWLLPFIGHMGIATSEGIMYDFAGPYTIGREHLAFGAPTRFLQLTISAADAPAWDRSVAQGCAVYETRMHNLCCDNCHSHVATCLEHFEYSGRKRWDMVTLCLWMFCCGRYVGPVAFLKSWLPFVVVIVVLWVVM